MNGQDQKAIEKLQAQQAGRDIADTAGRAASTYIGGAGGAKAYDAISKTKTGQKTLDKAGEKMANRPFLGKKLAKKQPAISSAKSTMDSALGANPKESKAPLNSLVESNGGNGLFQTIKTGLYIKIAAFSTGLLMFLLLIIVILSAMAIIISPFVYIGDKVSETGEKLFNLFSGCGWSTDVECNKKLENNFYDKIDSVYNEYKEDKNVELNKNLIVGTLTYVDPYLTIAPEIDDTSSEYSSSLIDYKKSAKQVESLAKNMVKEVKTCYLKDKEDKTLLSVDCSLKDYEKKKYEFVEKKEWFLDIEKYKNYLQDEFVVKYYLDNNLELKSEAIDITNEIFNRVAFYEDLMANQKNMQTFFVQNSTMVTINDSNGIFLEKIPLKDYLFGVVYAQMDSDSSEEYLKFVAVAAKNYLYYINGASKDSATQDLYIQNTELGQIYCSISKGCHYRESNGYASNTVLSGADENNNYFKPPINDMDTIKKIRNAVDSTTSDFILDGNNLVNTKYTAENKNDVLEQLKTLNYKEALVAIYGGSVDAINLYATAYPLDLENTRVTSGFGWRLHPTAHFCRTHNGTDIGASANANIYSIADGVVTEIGYQPNAATGLGNYIIIGHGNKADGYYQYYSLYAHMINPPVVDLNQSVSVGQLIGNVGKTGAATGEHLHIEIYSYVDGKKVRQDPAASFKNVQLTGEIGPMYNSEEECKLAN